MRYTLFFIALWIVTCFSKAYAQDTTQRYPCAILLQVSSEHNRMVALTRNGRPKDLEQLRKDALMVQQSILADFRENFHYCPVYFFLDTNAGLIKDKHFSGVLMAPDSTTVTSPTPCLDSGRYLIVYYGSPVSQSRNKAISDNEEDNFGAPAGRGLIILNEDYRQVSYIYKLGTAQLFGEAKKKKNYYSSARFDIEYYPLAERFDKRLRQRRDQTTKIRVSK